MSHQQHGQSAHQPSFHFKHSAHTSLQCPFHVFSFLGVHCLVICLFQLFEDLHISDVSTGPLTKGLHTTCAMVKTAQIAHHFMSGTTASLIAHVGLPLVQEPDLLDFPFPADPTSRAWPPSIIYRKFCVNRREPEGVDIYQCCAKQ